MIRLPYALLTACGLALLAAAGCSEPALDPAVVAAHRTRLELADEPDGAQTVLEVRQAMFGEETAETHDHAHEGDERADHDHADGDHADHDHAADAGDDAEEPAAAEESDEHADHEHDEEAHADGEHADHDHAAPAEEHADHDHDGDGVQDHAPEDHDHAIADANKKPVIDELDVVLVGSVGGVPNPSDQSHPEFPFTKGKAMFFLADPEAVAEMEEHEHVHADGEECAFCAAHAGDSAHMLAVVQFTDEKGKTLPVDARELFELKEKETVVVRGKAKVDPSGMLIVDATGLYVRR